MKIVISLFFLLLLLSSSSNSFATLLHEKTCKEPDLNAAELFVARVYSSCGSDDSVKVCSATYIGKNNLILPATCVYGYTNIKVCIGSDSCFQDGYCIEVSKIFILEEFIKDLHNRGCLGQNLALIHIPYTFSLNPVSIPVFSSATNCDRFTGETNLFSLGCGSNCLQPTAEAIKSQQLVQLFGVSTHHALKSNFPQVKCSGCMASATTIYAIGNASQSIKFGVNANDDGAPLLILGQDLYRYDLDCKFRSEINPGKYYFLGFLSHYSEPCDANKAAGFLCIENFLKILRNFSFGDWITHSMAQQVILQTANNDFTADYTLAAYGLTNIPDTEKFQKCIKKYLNETLRPKPDIEIDGCDSNSSEDGTTTTDAPPLYVGY